MIIVFLKNIFMPIFAVTAVISLINFIIDGKRVYAYVSIVTALLAAIALFISIISPASDLFVQLYLLLFLLSISLVIMALKKQIDAFTLIGIILMVVMLYLLLKFPLV
ncbi:hypothetical protein NH286_07920 [Anaerococcus sp. NML200574]|uniref:hypothetical protein n=1 Tax=Anaerococcus sp. NML200574 TaxID=2954486 RepID=UPI002238F1EA|nr:hypothetical protein [Anaerococcus sp. NML200574]MCW6679079.1 hypothetical protein [Anaerococcus sp. NML200574]